MIIPRGLPAQNQVPPTEIRFVRQATQRLIFDEKQSIPLAKLDPGNITGMPSMHPAKHHLPYHAQIRINEDNLVIDSGKESQTSIWFGGFNPFATYRIDLESWTGEGELGFEFSAPVREEQFIITVGLKDKLITGVQLKVLKDSVVIANEQVATNNPEGKKIGEAIILQMLGSGMVVYSADKGLPDIIGQSDFNHFLDLRQKRCIQTFQSHLFLNQKGGSTVSVKKVKSALTTGVGLADMRAITYENGDPMLDGGRLWYTMSIRGRALPHHIQGVFSLNPTVFDIRLEGIILFDRKDGILRNEIASHVFFDRRHNIWRGLTTGFSAYADPEEEKQLLAIESKKDPRFGFSVMDATPFGMVGDIEDPHLIFDEEARKWRMLTCTNQNGYKAIVLESDHWNKGFEQIAGPVKHNSTGTSIQKIGNKRYCFSGSSAREIFIYSYPDLREKGTLKMDLPPWDKKSGTRVWPNIVELPEGYPFRYVALMMDRYNYPGMKGPNWSYGALYLYHGYY